MRKPTLILLFLALSVLALMPNAPGALYAAHPAEQRIASIATQPQVALGLGFACALQADGSIHCWGQNTFGALGNGTDDDSLNPVAVSGITNAIAVTAGHQHACALLADSTIWCWGANTNGQLGNGNLINSFEPVEVVGITTATSVSAGAAHTCATLANSAARCWGANDEGQLGDGSSDESDTPVVVSGLSEAIGIAAGAEHTCAVLSDSITYNYNVVCWGANTDGQLGNGTNFGSDTPVAVSGITNAKEIGVGEYHSCALLMDGTVYCWGLNANGQLGNGNTDPSNTPVTNTTEFGTHLAVGYHHTCVRLANGSLSCWGSNGNGELGNEFNPADYNQPHPVSAMSTAVNVAAGANFTCAFLGDGNLQCWGLNDEGQLGNGNTTSYNAPQNTLFITALAPIALSLGNKHACAVISNGTLRCWGDNLTEQLGFVGADQPLPVDVPGLENVVSVAASELATCALDATGHVTCWGSNTLDVLGLGAGAGNFPPTQLASLDNVIAISMGAFHACALIADGTLDCWGYNNFGQIGNGNSGGGTNATVPVAISGIDDVFAISLGENHTCALAVEGRPWCWGRGQEGQLGGGSFTALSSVPVEITSVSNAITIAAGGQHTCISQSSGTVWCWGSDSDGQLGQGGAIPGPDLNTPVQVASLSNVTSIAAGFNHNCVTFANDTPACWGDNGLAQLGNGNAPTDSSSPVGVSIMGHVNGLSLGLSFSCARVDNTDIYCWGLNFDGQIGVGTTGGSFDTPQLVGGLLPPVFNLFLPLVRR